MITEKQLTLSLIMKTWDRECPNAPKSQRQMALDAFSRGLEDMTDGQLRKLRQSWFGAA